MSISPSFKPCPLSLELFSSADNLLAWICHLCQEFTYLFSRIIMPWVANLSFWLTFHEPLNTFFLLLLLQLYQFNLCWVSYISRTKIAHKMLMVSILFPRNAKITVMFCGLVYPKKLVHSKARFEFIAPHFSHRLFKGTRSSGWLLPLLNVE